MSRDVYLSDSDEQLLHGDYGAGAALAMRVVQATARSMGHHDWSMWKAPHGPRLAIAGRRSGHALVYKDAPSPPSTTIAAPLTNDESSETRKRTTLATSAGSAMRSTG